MKKFVTTLMVLLLPTLALAQAETTGRVTGRVVDENGKPVAGATVTLSSKALQGERSLNTDSNGRYLASLLPSGEYVLVVTAPGRQTVGFSFRVSIGQTVPLDATLVKGELVEEVKVTGNITKLETTSSGENFSYENTVDQLPVVNRDIERVAELAPNISFGPSADTLSISGAPSFDTVVLLDGAEVSDPYFGSAPQLFMEEAVEEVQVITTGISARYGRFQGGVINATTKSGSNTFTAGVRIDLDQETWNQKTPAGESQSDQLNQVYTATAGGAILKDHLWFFGGGRKIPTQDQSLQTELSGQNWVQTSDETRWQLKLTGAITANHVIEASYLEYMATSDPHLGLPPADLRSTDRREDPRKTATLEYQGILSDKLFLNVQGTRKRVSVLEGGFANRGDPFLDFYGSGFQIWHNAWWDFKDASDRDNDTLSANLTQVLSTGSWGDHTLEYGIQYVNSRTAGENRQSATGFNLLNYDAFVSGYEFSNVRDPGYDPASPRFNMISFFDEVGGFSYRWEALPLGGDQKLKNTAVYVQDTWQKDRWRLDVGLRWEQYKGEGPTKTLNMDFKELAPRLGMTYNMDNNWQLQATWGKYISRFNDNIASTVSGVGGAPYIASLYTGPTQCELGTHCLDYDQVQQILRDDQNWEIVTTISDPKQPTRFLDADAHSPYAREYTLAVKRALPRSTGTFTVTYTNREYKDLLDDFIGGQGYVNVVDPKGSGAELEFDKTIWENTNQARRQYDALSVAWDYRPSTRWDLGGNWTYAHTRGNYEGEGENTPSSGSIIGNYPRSINQAVAIPSGYLSGDIRHRIRAWGNYRFDFGRAGNLSLGAIGTYQSGFPWSRTAGVDLADDPDYLNDYGTYTYYFDGRGNNRFNGFWALDLSSRYQVSLWKDLSAYVKLYILNVTNNDALTAFETGGSAEVNPDTGLLSWVPGDGFGQARNSGDYQPARSYAISLGAQW